MEDVGCRRIVDDYGLPQVAAYLREILQDRTLARPLCGRISLSKTNLDVVALVVVATLSEQTVMYNVVDV